MSSSPLHGPDAAINQAALDEFHAHLQKSTRILALLGAGLSASSGLPTFRGQGGLWRTHEATSLATPGAFEEDPGLVWQFYSHRRHMALQARPNAAHHALAGLARKMPGFQCLSQNVDGLSQRAEHPPHQLQLLHGTLFEVKCVDQPIVPSLAIPQSGIDPTSKAAQEVKDLDISDINTPMAAPQRHELPQCPKCASNLLRPGVVWFGEQLPWAVLQNVADFIDAGDIDLIMVIGTSAKVFPAAGYIAEARDKGARVCVVNTDRNDSPPGGWNEGDWLFLGDAAVLVPRLLEPIVGEVKGS